MVGWSRAEVANGTSSEGLGVEPGDPCERVGAEHGLLTIHRVWWIQDIRGEEWSTAWLDQEFSFKCTNSEGCQPEAEQCRAKGN